MLLWLALAPAATASSAGCRLASAANAPIPNDVRSMCLGADEAPLWYASAASSIDAFIGTVSGLLGIERPLWHCLVKDTNAYALKEDGGILIGADILSSVNDVPSLEADDHGALTFVIAHELAHHLQFWVPNLSYAPVWRFELQADCIAGVVSSNLDYASQDYLMRGAGVLAALGDLEVNEPQHHGTPTQRRNAFLYGFSKATMDSSSVEDAVGACLSMRFQKPMTLIAPPFTKPPAPNPL